MHYCALLITKEFPTKETIERIMKPFSEEDFYKDEASETRERPAFLWDWYQIGGRYNGRLKLKYGEENTAKYNWSFYAREPRNGRQFWSYLLTKMYDMGNRLFRPAEEDFFPTMGSLDGFLRVDGALIADILNIDDIGCYIYIDKDGNAYAREVWDGNEWHEHPGFDEKLKQIIADSADCWATVIDIHD